MSRAILPARRGQVTRDAHLRGVSFRVSFGFDGAGRVTEIFTSCEKGGSEIEAMARDVAVLLSIALQSGVPLNALAAAVTRDERDGAASLVGELLDLAASMQEGDA